MCALCDFAEVNVDRFRVVLAHEYRYLILKDWMLPHRWYHVCLTRELTTVTTFLDGKILQKHKLLMDVEVQSSQLTVGYLSPNISPGFTFNGMITQFNVWREALDDSAVDAISKCKTDIQGNGISWDGYWRIVNSSMIDIPLNLLCKKDETSQTRLLPQMNFYESAFICEGLGGHLSIPETHAEAKQFITNEFSRDYNTCSIFWSGIWDVLEEGVWRSHGNGSQLSDLVWAPDEPNGLHFENCGGLDIEGLADDDCETMR